MNRYLFGGVFFLAVFAASIFGIRSARDSRNAANAAAAYYEFTGSTGRLVLPCEIVSVHDGDTLTVDVTLRANVRLLDCWAPEITGADKAAGERSKAKLQELAAGKVGVLTVPLGNNLSESITFGRVLGRVSIDGKDMSQALVAAGVATKERP